MEEDMNCQVYTGNEPDFLQYQGYVADFVSKRTTEMAARGVPVLAQSYDRVLEQLNLGYCVVLLNDGNFIGYMTLYDLGIDETGMQWWEVGTGLVPEKLQGQGIGRMLYMEIVKRFPKDTLVCTTKNPVALHLSVSILGGFKIVSFAVVPNQIRQGLCYDAICFENMGCGICKAQQELGGTCYCRVRYPVTCS